MCGLFGQINDSVKHFDYRTFCTLGIVNDARGGDSCGIFIDGETEYGIEKDKYFASFMNNSKLINKTTKCHIAFGHCRKTSIGTTTLETAQPIIIKKDDKIVYVVMHNGTIYNYEELAKKYIPDINIEGMSDTQVMANIFYNKGFEVLKEYNGSGAFVIADYRKKNVEPVVYMFKGASKNSNNVVVEERPLWLTKSKSNAIFFSSIGNILFPINKNDDVYTLEENVLYAIKKQIFYKVKEYDRSNCFQNKQYTVTTVSNICHNICSGYDTYRNNGVWGGTKEVKQGDILPLPFSNYEMLSLEDTPYIIRYSKWDDIVVDENLHYHIKGDRTALLHGGYPISGGGYLVEKENNYCKVFWFWYGTLLKNKECFDHLEKIKKTFGVTIGEVAECYNDLVAYFGVLPYVQTGIYFKSSSCMARTLEEYSGTLKVPFTKITLTITNGKCFSKYFDTRNNPPLMIVDYDPNEDTIIEDFI